MHACMHISMSHSRLLIISKCLHVPVKMEYDYTHLSRRRLLMVSTVAIGCDFSLSVSFETVRFFCVKSEPVIGQTKSSVPECDAGVLAGAPNGEKAGGVAAIIPDVIAVVGNADIFMGSKALCVAGSIGVDTAPKALCVPTMGLMLDVPPNAVVVLDEGNANGDDKVLGGNALPVLDGNAGAVVPKGAEGPAANALGKPGAVLGKLGTGAASNLLPSDGKMAALEPP
jgi:hypothetical protein